MISVLIIDEMPLICNVLASILNEEPDIEVKGCATTFDDALEQVQGCDLALVSTTMPDDIALDLIRALNQEDCSTKVVAIGMVESEATVLRYVEAGIAGYVLREDSVEELIDKIRAVHKGEASVSPQIAAALMERVAELREICLDETVSRDLLDDLTPREQEVLTLLQQKLSNREIADRLVIEVGTVKNHVHRIFKKLNLNSRRDIGAHLISANGHTGAKASLILPTVKV